MSPRSRNRFVLPLLIFLIGVGVSGGISYLFFQNLDDQLQTRFESDTDRVASLLDSRMNLYTNVLYGAEGLFAASQSVEEEEWKAYANGLDAPKNYRGISSLLYIQRVPASDVADFFVPIYPTSTDKTDYYPITYTQSFLATTSTTTSIGFDLSSEQKRATALKRAAETGDPSATGVVSAVNSQTQVFSIYAPVYAHDASHTLDQLTGYVAAVFRVKELFEGFAADPSFPRNIDLMITDTADGATLLDTSVYRQTESVTRTDLARTLTIDIAGRAWNLEFVALGSYSLGFLASLLPWVVLIGGVLLSALMSVVVYSLLTSRQRALALATSMTKDLAKAKAQAEATLGSLGEGVVVADATGKIIYNNKAAEEIIGMKFNTDVPHSYEKTYGVFYPDEKTPMPDAEQALPIALTGKAVINMPEFIRNATIPNGRHIVVSAQPVVLPDGTVVGAACSFRDTQKEFEVDRAKTEFVSLASHQLRTPLTSIKWYAELLEDSETLGKDDKSNVTEIRDAADRMNALVVSLLDISRLDLGTFVIEPETADLLKVLETAAKEQEPTFKEKKQTFVFNKPTGPIMLSIDTKLAFIIVQNLLSNAHKYSPEGATITLSLAKTTSGSYELSVADTGYGIPASQQDSVFKKMFRAENIRTLDVEGTGLGLYMIKTIVDAAGCNISFTSTEGKGTTFTITFPPTGMKRKEGTKTLSGS